MRAALLATDWKTEYGIVVQVGVFERVDELNELAGWVSEHRRLDTIAYDPLEKLPTSLLDGLKKTDGASFTAPPSMNGRVKLTRDPPKLHFPILFLHAASMESVLYGPILDRVVTGTVVYGAASACAMVLEAAQCKAQPLYFHRDRIAVRIS